MIGKSIYGYAGFIEYTLPPTSDPINIAANGRNPDEKPAFNEFVIIPWPRIAEVLPRMFLGMLFARNAEEDMKIRACPITNATYTIVVCV
jgi:hypothetical protein